MYFLLRISNEYLKDSRDENETSLRKAGQRAKVTEDRLLWKGGQELVEL